MYCPNLFGKIEKGIDEEKSTEEIFKSVCGAKIKHPERKLRRIIKLSIGNEKAQEFLEKHAEILKYKKPHNPTGKNKKSEVKNFTSGEGIAEEDETPEEIAEEELQIPIKPIVKKRLDFIMENYITTGGEPIDTYNKAIRFALRKAELWDILE